MTNDLRVKTIWVSFAFAKGRPSQVWKSAIATTPMVIIISFIIPRSVVPSSSRSEPDRLFDVKERYLKLRPASRTMFVLSVRNERKPNHADPSRIPGSRCNS